MRVVKNVLFYIVLILAMAACVAVFGPGLSLVKGQDQQPITLTFEEKEDDLLQVVLQNAVGTCRFFFLFTGEELSRERLETRGWGEGDCAANYSPKLRPSEWRTPGFLGSKPGYLGYHIPERLFLAIRPVGGQWGDAELIEVTQQVLLHNAFGRVIDETLLRTNPNGSKVKELFAGQEFKALDFNNGWYEVVTAHGDVGWLPAEVVDLAVTGDENLRRYAHGFCYANPEKAQRKDEAELLSQWQHELVFADEVVLPNEDEALVFQGNALQEERQYRVTDSNPAVIELNAFWVGRHPSLPDLGRIGWQHTAAWQLIYECEA